MVFFLLTYNLLQTLTTLRLGANEIRNQETHYFADVLRHNRVLSFSYYLVRHSHYFVQTLTTLDIRHNTIDSKGIQHLTNALRENRVMSLPSHRVAHLPFFTDSHHIGH